MADPRCRPYISATWLARTMSGATICQWQYWFQAHYRLEEQLPTTFDRVAWRVQHTRALSELRRDLRRRGIKTWGECEFRLREPHHDAVVAGRVDCVAFPEPDVVLFDVKTGARRAAHQSQLMIHMHAMGRDDRFTGRQTKGVLVYPDGQQEIACLPPGFDDDVEYFVGLLVGDEEPERDPGSGCRLCNVIARDCPARVDG